MAAVTAGPVCPKDNQSSKGQTIAVCAMFFEVYKDVFDRRVYKEMLEALTMTPKTYMAATKAMEAKRRGDPTGGVHVIRAFGQTHETWLVPKFFGPEFFKDYIDRNQLVVTHVSNPGRPMVSEDSVFRGALRTDVPQLDAYNCIMKHYGLPQRAVIPKDIVHLTNAALTTGPMTDEDPGASEHKGAVVQLPCGFGKTILSIAVMLTLKVRTMVIVHTEFLMNQWIAKLKQFAPGVSCGVLQQNKCSLLDDSVDIVVAMVHTIACRDEYGRDLYDTIGLLVVDECHHMAAPYFSTALHKINAKYTLGLSATPDRPDGLEQLLYYTMGPLIFTAEREVCSDNIKAVQIVYTLGDQREYKNRAGDLLRPKMVTKLIEDKHRTELVTAAIMAIEHKRRKTIVLSERLSLLHELHDKIVKLTGSSVVCKFYVGGMKQKQRDDSEKNGQIILATYKMAAEALDIPLLDTMVFATPATNLVQAVGRILRVHPDKCTPMIIDIVDPYSCFDASSWKRFNFYKTSGYRIWRLSYPDDLVAAQTLISEKREISDACVAKFMTAPECVQDTAVEKKQEIEINGQFEVDW